MKILGFVGSPREGSNTEIMVKQILSGASENGAQTKIFNLSKMNIAPCSACMHCKANDGRCATDDDMQTIYKEIQEADAFILGSPVYMWQMTAQSKLFLDRLYAFYMTGFEKKYGKKDMALVFSQGNPDGNLFAEHFEYLKNMFGFLGYNVVDLLSSTDNTVPGAVADKQDIMNKAFDIGKKLSGQ